MNKEIRDNKTEIKGVGSSKPFIYDDGNNNYRIKYRDIKGKIYICEVFDRESDQIKDIEDPAKSRDIQDYDFIHCSIDRATMKINYKD